jgi:hypothetical protein
VTGPMKQKIMIAVALLALVAINAWALGLLPVN